MPKPKAKAKSKAQASCDQRSEQCQPVAVVAQPSSEPHVMDRINDKAMATVVTAKNTMLTHPIFNDILNAKPDTKGSQSEFTRTSFSQSREAGNKTFICGGNMFMAELFNYPTSQKPIYMTKVEYIVNHFWNPPPRDGTGPYTITLAQGSDTTATGALLMQLSPPEYC